MRQRRGEAVNVIVEIKGDQIVECPRSMERPEGAVEAA
jgi:hypothetical protein